jgi:Phage tail assembly chaperone protein
MNYTVYDSNTGKIELVFTSHDANLVEQNLKNCSWIPGNFSSVEYYIVNGSPVPKPPAPQTPGQIFDFDYSTKDWKINIELSIRASRQLRNIELQTIDRINPVWFNSLTPEQQQDLITYRQLLLAVPQQSGFPATIDWPAKPTWL